MTNQTTRASASLPEELKQEIQRYSDWRVELSTRYLRVSTDPVFKGHPMREEVLELLEDGIEHLEICIKTRRDKLAELN